MKPRFLSWSVVFLLASFPGTTAPAQESLAGLGKVRISMIVGSVEVETPDSDGWDTALVNMPLVAGARIRTQENGRVELEARGGTYIRLDGDTDLAVLSIADNEVRFFLSEGRVYVNNGRGGLGLIAIGTPHHDFECSHNAVFEVAADAGGGCEFDVAGLYDEWTVWNRVRDGIVLDRGESFRYLPAALQDNSWEFDTYGRWVHDDEYGFVWTPTVVSEGWAPYHEGTWDVIGNEYVWISYDPWGWVPCHYGRWAFRASLGWCWVPPAVGAVYWAPACVGWIRTEGFVAWVPLAPGEAYYGGWYAGPRSVEGRRPGRYFYRNARVRNGLTVQGWSGFSRGDRMMHRRNAENVRQRQHYDSDRRWGHPDKERKTELREDESRIMRHVNPGPTRDGQRETRGNHERPGIMRREPSTSTPNPNPRSMNPMKRGPVAGPSGGTARPGSITAPPGGERHQGGHRR